MRHTMLSALFLTLAGLSGCAQPESLPAADTLSQRFVGPWRVTHQDGPQVFSDYVFGKDGTLSHLLSVANGQPVDAMQGAGLVHCPSEATQPVCTFGDKWYSRGVDTLVIDGRCTDQTPREIELQFADETRAAAVAVHSVDGQSGWSEMAAWRFQKCDLHACD